MVPPKSTTRAGARGTASGAMPLWHFAHSSAACLPVSANLVAAAWSNGAPPKPVSLWQVSQSSLNWPRCASLWQSAHFANFGATLMGACTWHLRARHLPRACRAAGSRSSRGRPSPSSTARWCGRSCSRSPNFVACGSVWQLAQVENVSPLNWPSTWHFAQATCWCFPVSGKCAFEWSNRCAACLNGTAVVWHVAHVGPERSLVRVRVAGDARRRRVQERPRLVALRAARQRRVPAVERRSRSRPRGRTSSVSNGRSSASTPSCSTWHVAHSSVTSRCTPFFCAIRSRDRLVAREALRGRDLPARLVARLALRQPFERARAPSTSGPGRGQRAELRHAATGRRRQGEQRRAGEHADDRSRRRADRRGRSGRRSRDASAHGVTRRATASSPGTARGRRGA